VARGESLDGELGHAWRTAAASSAQTVKLIVSRSAAADFERLHAFLAAENASSVKNADFRSA
jgi:hypothetical protein